MKVKVFHTLHNYHLKDLPKDILTGIIIAAVSILISMGYAEVSGIPAIYGLYGSVFPIILFALFSTSPQFIFGWMRLPLSWGCDGYARASGGIAGSHAIRAYDGSFAGLWLLLFYFLRAGRMVDFISTPVMGGFISGIAVTIILMQIPKVLGSGSGSGELLNCLKIYWKRLDM